MKDLSHAPVPSHEAFGFDTGGLAGGVADPCRAIDIYSDVAMIYICDIYYVYIYIDRSIAKIELLIYIHICMKVCMYMHMYMYPAVAQLRAYWDCGK